MPRWQDTYRKRDAVADLALMIETLEAMARREGGDLSIELLLVGDKLALVHERLTNPKKPPPSDTKTASRENNNNENNNLKNDGGQSANVVPPPGDDGGQDWVN